METEVVTNTSDDSSLIPKLCRLIYGE